MKTGAKATPRTKPTPAQAALSELAELRLHLADAEEALRAIRAGEVDAVVVAGKKGRQVFTLEGAETAYRVLIESMNEGALTLTTDKTILYANECFARMVKCPLEQVTGSSFRRFLSDADRAALRTLMKMTVKTGSKILVQLHTAGGLKMPVQLSIRPLERDALNRLTISMVVTDMTEARRSEEQLRALTHRLVHAQESERGRVALELHDGITQHLCAVLFHSQALADKLPQHVGSGKKEALQLRAMLGKTADEVQRIARNLRPSVLEHLGLCAALRETSTEFTDRTRVPVKLECVELLARPPADTELALYRILQEALRNVEKHARARHVTVTLTKPGGGVLTIKDDGIGFDPERGPAKRKKDGLGLLGMRERAASVGSTFELKSTPAGTEIEIRLPAPVSTAATH